MTIDSTPDVRAAEVAAKLALLRETLAQSGAGAIRLRGLDWVSWVTAGADTSVLLALDSGAAEVLVTRDDAVILTDEIEGERLRQEQVPPGFTYHIAPWAEVELRETYVLGAAAGAAVLTDRPNHVDQPLPASLRLRRMVLGDAEQARYRALGRDAAAAVGEVLRAARPEWTEFQLAGATAQALWARGIQPAAVLAAGERRLPLFCHAPPTHERLGGRASLQVCARRHGLYANLTRSVSFGPAPAEQTELLQVEATGLDAVHPGNSLAAVYHALDAAYRHANRPEAMRRHHQGGVTGYAAREIVATPSTATGLETGMALAFNPGFAGIKIEDTFLLGASGLENLTLDPHWPSVTVQGRVRPLWLENP
ncbi:MAG: M24 family metallopeptidase [Oxalobacteraceae bacterium]|nr:MAG: M24 family metallopeptidase [Oxalobacteraceae bacterium]